MKKKSDKHREAQALRRELEQAQHLFVTSFEKLTVAQDFELRRTVRSAGGRYRVVKNNLAEKAAEGTPAQGVLKGLRGMTSLAYTTSDPVALAKALTNYAKANPSFTFKAGLVEGRAVEVRSIEELANLPSREAILAKVLYLIQAPAQRLVTAINAVGRDLAIVLDQAAKENKFGDPQGPEPQPVS
jgi:large subunit ribosomal protein L10